MNQSTSSPVSPFYIASLRSEVQQPNAVETSSSPFPEVTSASVGFLVLFTSFILLCCSMRRWKSSESPSPSSEENKFWPEKLTFELPCTRCHYFKANRYLPCAVNPTVALKPEAMECTDFKEKDIEEEKNVIG